jgi:predicted O-methyltransferase YrrM
MVPLTTEILDSARDPRSTDEILSGIVHGQWECSQDWWKSRRYYPCYAGLAKLVKPDSILEIGVRLGFSMISMYRGHPEVSVLAGIDNQTYDGESVKKAEENIRAVGFAKTFELYGASSHGFSMGDALRGRLFDIVHVDGDHSALGAFQDFLEYWNFVRPGGVMVADDANFTEVRKAIESARHVLCDLSWDSYHNHDSGWHLFGKKSGS